MKKCQVNRELFNVKYVVHKWFGVLIKAELLILYLILMWRSKYYYTTQCSSYRFWPPCHRGFWQNNSTYVFIILNNCWDEDRLEICLAHPGIPSPACVLVHYEVLM